MVEQTFAFLNDEHGKSCSAQRSPYAFLQWKGTDACFDFHCECGTHNNFDGYFAYVVQCANTACGLKWEMPVFLYPRKVCAGTYAEHTDDAKLMNADDDD